MRLTAHILDSSLGSMPATIHGDATLDDCGGLHVGGRSVQRRDIVSMHEGACDHPADPRSDRARRNFGRKYR